MNKPFTLAKAPAMTSPRHSLIRRSALAIACSLAISSSLVSLEANAGQLTRYTYNENGQVLTVDGPRTDVNDITTYGYNDQGFRSSITNALGHTITLGDFTGRGLPQQILDANFVETRLSYHIRGWLETSTVVHPSGDESLNSITTYRYDKVGNVIAVVLPNGVELSYHYDTSNRLVGVSNQLGERMDYVLDKAGNRISETITSASGTLRYSMTQAFDELSRVMEIVGSEGQTTHIDYDVNNNPVNSINPRQYGTQSDFDPLDRLVETVDPDNGTTRFSYDDQDRLTSVTDANGNTTTYGYDAYDNLIEQVSPDTGRTTYGYDEANNRITMTDARGITANYTYDAINRLSTVEYPNYPEENVSYHYDPLITLRPDGTSPIIYGIGRLVDVIDHSGRSHYEYDHRGNVVRVIQSITLQPSAQDLSDPTTISYTTDYQYDLANNLTQMTYPNGRVVNYQRDSLGRVSRITQEPNEGSTPTTPQIIVDQIQYLPFGGITQITYGNGVQTTLDYDQDYRLSRLTAHAGSPLLGTASLLQDLSYSYDLNSNIIQYDNLATDSQQRFDYDPLDRLSQAQGDYGQQDYSYDLVGNRTDLDTSYLNSLLNETIDTQSTYQTNSNNNQLDDIHRQITTPSITVDNRDLEQISLTGSWSSSGVQPPFGSDSQYSGSGTFTWHIPIPTAGYYDIQAWWTAHQAVRSDGAQYVFTSANGEQTVLANHKLNGGQWNSLGVHPFTEGTLSIRLQNTAAGSISADAIRLVPSNQAQQQAQFYDANGNTIESQREGTSLYTTYNAANRPQTMTVVSPEGTLTAEYRYNALGQRVSKTITQPNGEQSTHHYHYDLQGLLITETNLTTLTEKNTTYLNGQPIATHTTNKATEGTPTVIDNLDANTQTIGSWNTSSVQPPYQGNSQYANGNAQFIWQTTIPATQEYEIQAWWTSHSIRTNQADYQFTSQDQQETVSVNQRTKGGQWNSLGRYTLSQGNFEISLSNQGAGSLSADAIRLIPLSTTDTLHYIHNDHLGTPQIVTDQSQEKVWEARYTPFGEAELSTELVEQNLRFPGQYYDEETGLHYNWFRYYDPQLGRFTQSDPIGLGDGPNTYAYVANNPLIYYDPDGESKKLAEFILAVVLTIGGDGDGDGKPGGTPGRRDPTPNEQVQEDRKKKPNKKKKFGKNQGGAATPEFVISLVPGVGLMFGDTLACGALDCDGDGLIDSNGLPLAPENPQFCPVE